MEKFRVIDFTKEHIDQAVTLDKKWFGKYGADRDDFLSIFSIENKYALALVLAGTLKGFAVFDVLEPNTEVDDYKGLTTSVKTAFIQQFTTEPNYEIDSWESDSVLLNEVEDYVSKLGCLVVWEALSKDHPFAVENNPKHDAYGFYDKQGYFVSKEHTISWREEIPCNLLFKKLD